MEEIKNFIKIQKNTNIIFLMLFVGLIMLSIWVIEETLYGSFGIIIIAFSLLFVGNYRAMLRIKNG